MITKEYERKGNKIRVTFELPPSVLASQINVVGEFSGWEKAQLAMTQAQPNGNWKLTLDLDAGRCYRFRYLIDGQDWLNDVFADDHVENPYGSYDSVVDLREFA